jgi:HPt (histidine-containing phosphotransfer) domain-containing protein
MHHTDAVPFDREEMLERLGGDKELLVDVVGVFLEECPRMLQEIEDAFGSKDVDLLRRAAHSMKGACLNLSAGPAAEEAKQLELLAAESRLDGTEHALERLRVAVERLQRVLSEQTAA